MKPFKLVKCVLLAGMTMAALSSQASITLAVDGIGYIHASLNPTDMNVGVLNNMIGYYNGGPQPASTIGLGSKTATYYVDAGTATPGTLSPAGSLASEVTPTVAQGYGTSTLTFTLTSAQDYLVVQWDGPNGGDVFYYIGGLYQGTNLTVSVVNDMPDGMSQYGVSGYWLASSTTTPVPEASTIVAGITLLLPLGISAMRTLRRKPAKF